MHLLYYLFCLLLGIIDFILLSFTVYINYFNLIIFSIFHLLIFEIYRRLNLYYKKEVSLFYCFVIFFPGIGLFLIIIVDFLLKKSKSDLEIVEDEEDYLKYVEQSQISGEIDVFKEVNLLSILDRIKYSTEQEKKEAIINFTTDDIELKVKILQTALLDENPEVIHYAASTLNSLEQDFEKKIADLKERYFYKNETKVLRELIKLYSKYINSGLLVDEIKITYQKEYLKILNKAQRKFENEYRINLKIAKTHNQLKNYSKARDILRKLIENHPYKYKAYLLLMKTYYSLDQENKIIELATKIKENQIDIPKKQRELINFWS